MSIEEYIRPNHLGVYHGMKSLHCRLNLASKQAVSNAVVKYGLAGPIYSGDQFTVEFSYPGHDALALVNLLRGLGVFIKENEE